MAVKSLSSAQLELFTIPSPCIGVCQSGENGFCVGCFRTREERLYWLQIDEATKRAVIIACQRRQARATRKAANKNTAADNLGSQQDMFRHTES